MDEGRWSQGSCRRQVSPSSSPSLSPLPNHSSLGFLHTRHSTRSGRLLLFPARLSSLISFRSTARRLTDKKGLGSIHHLPIPPLHRLRARKNPSSPKPPLKRRPPLPLTHLYSIHRTSGRTIRSPSSRRVKGGMCSWRKRQGEEG
jgi:hypothetical protein